MLLNIMILLQKKLYNKHLMNIISTYNKVIPKENLHKPKYDYKIKMILNMFLIKNQKL